MREVNECEGLETYAFSSDYFCNDITSHFKSIIRIR